jgi:hypothetical protein
MKRHRKRQRPVRRNPVSQPTSARSFHIRSISTPCDCSSSTHVSITASLTKTPLDCHVSIPNIADDGLPPKPPPRPQPQPTGKGKGKSPVSNGASSPPICRSNAQSGSASNRRFIYLPLRQPGQHGNPSQRRIPPTSTRSTDFSGH